MDGIERMIEEHENITAFIQYLKRLCCSMIDGKEADVQEFYGCIEFVRNYADKHHHGKEEQILFQVMLEKLGAAVEKLIRNGMLVEHDLARYHIGKLEEALVQYSQNPTTEGKFEIIIHAGAYVDILQRHIEKENAVCYAYALRMLSQEDKNRIDERIRRFEKQAQEEGVQEKYLAWLKERIL